MRSAPAHAAAATSVSLQPWLVSGAVVLLLAVVFFAHWQTVDSLFTLWGDTALTTYTHGFFTLAIAVWMIFRRRDQLAALDWTPSLPAAALTLVLGFFWLVSLRAGIELFHQVFLVATLWTAVWAAFGLRIALQLWVPIGFLMFAVPVWEVVNAVLQEGTVRAVSVLLKFTSVPAWVQGNFVHLASGVFEIAGGCSGLHFMIVALALGVVYGELGFDRFGVRAKLVALAAGLALLANWLRVFIIVIAGYATDMQHYLIRKEHYTFGWVVFSAMMLVFFVIARRIAPPLPAQRDAASARAAIGLHASRAPLGLIALACILAAPAFALWQQPSSAPLGPPFVDSLRVPSGWTRDAPGTDWNPVFSGADRIERAAFVEASGRRVEVLVASYASQGQDKELVTYFNRFIGPDEGAETSSAPVGDSVRQITVQNRDRRSVIRYVYDIGGYRTSRGLAAQLRYGLTSLSRVPVSAVFATRAACTEVDCADARRVLDDFNAALPPGVAIQ
ncbi:MAG TPA: exosortase A [Steroidobacteraceae bacterium]|nr:exosortase A [Steroidobacteraceae bacterium]